MHTKNIVVVGLLALGGANLACESPEGLEDESVMAHEAPPSDVGTHRAAMPASSKSSEHSSRPRVAPDAKRSFEKMVELIDAHYVDGPLSEDELWTAAMEGVMARLIQLDDLEINTLLAPDQLEELMSGTKGSIVGVGIMIEQVHDVLMVKGTIPGGPAQQAGLRAGDRILAVDGKQLENVPLPAAVDMIRGAEGTTVALFVQRGTEEWTVSIARALVKVDSVQAKMLSDSVGYARINSFTESTVADLDVALTSLDGAGMRGLVLDLRRNPGGLLEPALASADRFLPVGARILTTRGREGEEHEEARETHAWESTPLVVLTGPETASGAEILAAALDEHERAAIVGERTRGKGTVESIHDLPNGWALKLSISRFFSPHGEPRQANGVVPDFTIPTPEATLDATLDEVSVDGDPALRAALELLR